jgi:predicted Fe-S protein YdhL (DUF1289 family)
MNNLDELFDWLAQSQFRRQFHLRKRERHYLQDKGMAVILDHARTFVGDRLAPAEPKNDGKQTPWGNHPVFVAQHATATCCRGCLQKWHGIPKGRSLTATEQDYIIRVIEHWLQIEIANTAPKY